MPLEKMVEYAHRRWHIEAFHEGGKSLLGWDEYQGRRWTGFHRQATIIMLTYSFLRGQEWRQRQEKPRSPGRPRYPFSPRRDRRQLPLEEIHRQTVNTLWEMAVDQRIQQKIDTLRLPMRN